MAIIDRIKIKWVIFFTALVLSVNLLFLANKNYRYQEKFLTTDQYNQLISKTPEGYRIRVILYYRPLYFDLFPAGTINVFYVCYLLAVCLTIVYFNRKFKDVDEEMNIQRIKGFLAKTKFEHLKKQKHNERPTKQTEETMAEFAQRLIDWNKQQKSQPN